MSRAGTTVSAAIRARIPVLLVTSGGTARSRGRITASVARSVVEAIRHADTAALRLAMAMLGVRLARSHVKYVVDIQSATRHATSRVLLVRQTHATRAALIRSVRCHVLHHATGFHALSGARKCWNVAISVSLIARNLLLTIQS